MLDCDVLQADGGTRTAAITGAYVALADAVAWARGRGLVAPVLRRWSDSVAAVSVGIVDGAACLDLHYDDDVRAETDMNVVMTGSGRYVEVQGTAEREPFDRRHARRAARPRGPGLRGPGRPAGGRPGWSGRRGSGRWCRGRLVTARVVLATRNEGKVGELRRILSDAGLDIELVGAQSFAALPDIAETGATFAANALLKARAVAAYTGLPAVADDSGLCVDALNGMPGILSARWAGGGRRRRQPRPGAGAAVRHPRRAARRALLLRGGRGPAARAPRARGECRVVEGTIDGMLLRERRGTGGFGYDPIFLPYGSARTTAETGRRREGRDQPPRPGLPGAGPGAGRPPGRVGRPASSG